MIFDRLLKSCAKKQIEELVLCVLKHDAVAVEKLLQKKVDPNGVWKEDPPKSGGGEEMTPLYAATLCPQDGSVEMVNLLIKYGAEVNTVIYVDEVTLLSPLCNSVFQHYHNPKSLDVYCALRDAGAQMFCEPVRPPLVAPEQMKRWSEDDYRRMDVSIHDLLEGSNLHHEWEHMENEYLIRRQKKILTNVTEDIALSRPRRSSKL